MRRSSANGAAGRPSKNRVPFHRPVRSVTGGSARVRVACQLPAPRPQPNWPASARTDDCASEHLGVAHAHGEVGGCELQLEGATAEARQVGDELHHRLAGELLHAQREVAAAVAGGARPGAAPLAHQGRWHGRRGIGQAAAHLATGERQREHQQDERSDHGCTTWRPGLSAASGHFLRLAAS